MPEQNFGKKDFVVKYTQGRELTLEEDRKRMEAIENTARGINTLAREHRERILRDEGAYPLFEKEVWDRLGPEAHQLLEEMVRQKK